MDRADINRMLDMGEDELDRLANSYENDTWDASQVGKTIMGRPRLADEETRAITVRLPVSQIADIDRTARKEGRTRSAAIREALQRWLDSAAAL